MAIGINWAEIWQPVWGPVWTDTPPSTVEVPDVVGQTQASGTAELEAVLFVVAVVSVFDSATAGTIIAQSPIAGSQANEGSTVTITVSAGPRPSSSSEGSGGIWYEMERVRARKKRRDIDKEVEEIDEPVAREIAALIKTQEARDEERANLARLQAIADRYSKPGEEVPRPILASVMKAHEERTQNALEQLQREISRMLEEDEMAVLSLLLDD